MGGSSTIWRLDFAKSIFRHTACIVALMWMALVNGQPFFFPDTTAYVRAADVAVYVASGHRISTEWTARYSDALAHRPNAVVPSGHPGANDIGSGQIMSGRSPYIGAALYAAYVVSNFWLFVVAQAALSYWLIRLALRRFGIAGENAITAVVLLLAASTSLPYFNGLLLADALASFGILAFLLLATDEGAYSRIERAILWSVVILSAISHLTHIVMLLGMVTALFGLQLMRWAPANERAIIGGGLCLLIGFLSTSLTSYAVERVFHRPPQLVPLMTARFIADGPGERFIQSGCGGQDFEVCRLRAKAESSSEFLWSSNPALHGFTTATPAQRARMSSQDTAFALAALKAYPAEQARMMAYNSAAQMLTFGFDGLNTGCWKNRQCWKSLPPDTREELRRSLSGRNLWPDHEFTVLLYFGVVASVILLFAAMPLLWRSDPALARTMAQWLVLAFVAMAICDVLGGAISEPQYRYQGRLVWLVVLFAAATVISARRGRRAAGLSFKRLASVEG